MKDKPARYSIDKNNRLVIETNGIKLIPNGSFSIDNKNRLVYWLNESDKIVFTGKWSLNQNHDLELEIGRGSSLVFKGEIISADSGKLAFEINSINDEGSDHLRILELSGSWGSDEANRIFFTLTKEYKQDVLKFRSGWRLNQNQQIVYAYQKTNLKTKTKASSELTIDGFWEVTSANRLRYIISRGTGSRFDFKVQLETPTIYPKDKEIRYRLGVGLKENRRPKAKIISLYGAWKLSRALGLMFEMEYSKGEMHSLSFGAEVNFDRNNQVAFNLKGKNGKDLGMSVIFTHKFLRQSGAEWFLRLKHFQKESGVDGGLKIPF